MKKIIDKLRIIPLGGIGEIGKNLTLIEYGHDIIAIDCGLEFPDADTPGVDYIIPDMQYIIANQDRIKAIFITHGHEDHIGALPFLLRQVNVPIYGTKLTLGIIDKKLKEYNLDRIVDMNEMSSGDSVSCGNFKIEFIHVNHSISDAVAIAIHTALGTVLHMGDFKIDVSPIKGDMIDLGRLGQLGKNGVLALLMDSTNAEKPGFAMSERKVGSALSDIFMKASKQRIIVATFASNVDRVQQIINNAIKYKRKVAVSGRSMEMIIDVADRLGYMDIPNNLMIPLSQVNQYPPEKVVIITTGSQGEPMSALYRIAYSEHKTIEVTNRDVVILSSHTIPGNEKVVNKIINELVKTGATVVYENFVDVHVSGHACQEELKLIMALVKPKFFIPVHGEMKQLKKHQELAIDMGIPSKNIVIPTNGAILEITENKITQVGSVPAGMIYVDGLGVGDVGSIILKDRILLSQDGMLLVIMVVDIETRELLAPPEIITKGFVYLKENPDLNTGIKTLCEEILDDCARHCGKDWGSTAKSRIKTELSNYILNQTMRTPMVIPLIKIV